MNNAKIPTVGFTAIKTMNPGSGERWQKYIAWSGLSHLKEVISLDLVLCSSLVENSMKADPKKRVYVEYFDNLFLDISFLLDGVKLVQDMQIIAVMPDPESSDASAFTDPRFEFIGYDLIENFSQISAILNCKGFEKAYSPSDLSPCGLVRDHSKANEIRRLLRENYPDESHADCDIWAIWRMRSI